MQAGGIQEGSTSSFKTDIFVAGAPSQQPRKYSVLVDTGCELSAVVDGKTAQKICHDFEVGLVPLTKPKRISGYDGGSSQEITHGLFVPIQVHGHFVPQMLFYVARVSGHDFLLGYPWIRLHKGVIDCYKEQLQFPYDCQHETTPAWASPASLATPTTTPSPAIAIIDPNLDRKGKWMPKIVTRNQNLPPGIFKVVPELKVPTPVATKPKSLIQDRMTRQQWDEFFEELKQPITNKQQVLTPSPPLQQSKHGPRICAIGAVPFSMLSKKKDYEVFSISMKDIEAHRQNQDKEETDPRLVLPKEFHDYLDVFSKSSSDTLPPSRNQDCKIKLKPGMLLPRAEPLRRLSTEELDLVEDYIKKNLAKGFIEPSTFEYSSPILFVKKPGGGLRLCIDYRGLNAVTQRDCYPLPLIDETLSRLTKARVFSKLDIRQAFHRLRMATEEDENLTTFATRFGNYKYKIMPFGLCNAPSTFQRFMNDSFLDMLDRFVSIYLDDILIYSRNKKEHRKHIQQVLQRLRDIGLNADIDKCEFFVEEVKYLGLIITTSGIKMDPAKVEAIKNWETPRNGDIKAVRRFLGFVNFYRRFIKNFGRISGPLYRLLRKDALPWDKTCTNAFIMLKEAVSSDQVCAHFRPELQSFVECDASDSVVAGVLSQKDELGVLRPVAFFSTTMLPAERNYAIYDKELLAIVKSFEHFRPELQSTPPDLPTQVLSDHEALRTFMTNKQLSRRQARWEEFLSAFNFQIVYRKGAANKKADALTRRDPGPRASEDPNMFRTILPPEKLAPKLQSQSQVSQLSQSQLAPVDITEDQAPPSDLPTRIRTANKGDTTFDNIREAISQDGDTKKRYEAGYKLALCSVEDGVLLVREKMAIPQSMITEAIQTVHESKETGHPGAVKTIQFLASHYYFPGLGMTVRQFVSNCHVCRRAKPRHEKPNGLLHPLPAPERPNLDYTMDFVVDLPESGPEKSNAILVVVDRLSKLKTLIPCRFGEGETNATAVADLLYRHVWCKFGLPRSIVSDRDVRFDSLVWKALTKKLGIEATMSTAYHPQSDGQTEVANREINTYLRTFVNYQQNDWTHILPASEFAVNNRKSIATGYSPFELVYGYAPRTSIEPLKELEHKGERGAQTAYQDLQQRRAEEKASQFKELWDTAKENMEKAQEHMSAQANKHRNPDPLKVGDQVWLNAKNIRTERPSKKLDNKFYGPFPIIAQKGTSYELQLPTTMNIHPVFHPSLLSLHPDSPLEGQRFPDPDPIIIDNEPEWEVKEILDVRRIRGKLKTRVSWYGYTEDYTWYPIEFFENAQDALEEFYEKNPTKQRPTWLHPAVLSSVEDNQAKQRGDDMVLP